LDLPTLDRRRIGRQPRLFLLHPGRLPLERGRLLSKPWTDALSRRRVRNGRDHRQGRYGVPQLDQARQAQPEYDEQAQVVVAELPRPSLVPLRSTLVEVAVQKDLKRTRRTMKMYLFFCVVVVPPLIYVANVWTGSFQWPPTIIDALAVIGLIAFLYRTRGDKVVH